MLLVLPLATATSLRRAFDPSSIPEQCTSTCSPVTTAVNTCTAGAIACGICTTKTEQEAVQCVNCIIAADATADAVPAGQAYINLRGRIRRRLRGPRGGIAACASVRAQNNVEYKYGLEPGGIEPSIGGQIEPAGGRRQWTRSGGTKSTHRTHAKSVGGGFCYGAFVDSGWDVDVSHRLWQASALWLSPSSPGKRCPLRPKGCNTKILNISPSK
ncbi:hypothetical protein BD779DRAFT_1471990 [Infundibulicybe gibba]|nr:hypothetical protein BD779DRAFT_1471990 [Infundibulicybe gibba]